MSRKGKFLLGIVIGLIGAVAIFCLTVAIGCSVNGVSFGQQIVDWFGNTAPAITDAVETVVETPIA